MKDMKDKYSIHVVEMVRNNGITCGEKRDSAIFFMFDYFDVLFYKELKKREKRYLDYFSIIDTFGDEKDYKVSNKSLSLYKHTEENEVNPFKDNNDKEGELSSNPFIGLIQISLCKENFKINNKKQLNVDEFLTDCERKIWEMIERGEQEKKRISSMQLYRSSTTGDLCLVLRTDSVSEIYKIALLLNDSQSNLNEGIHLLTYTSVGIECKMRRDGSYCTLSADFVRTHADIAFAIRFSADNAFEEVIKEYGIKRDGDRIEPQLKKVKGLFGRYDYLMNIGLAEFAEIYPILCERKLGSQIDTTLKHEVEKSDLKNIISYSGIRNINERVLVDLPVLGDNNRETATDDEKKFVINKNKQLIDRIMKMDEWRILFSEENRAFQDLFRGMKELYKAFSAIGMEKNAYVNWLIFHRDMDIICNCLEGSIRKYKKIDVSDEETRKKQRLIILKSWRTNLQAINQYTRLVQNINYQTYQAPIYEIQTQIDTEKVIVAYREVMENYLRLYAENSKEEEKDRVIPIIHPDLSKDEVSVAAPFLSESFQDMKIEREIVCTVPSFEYFGRLYDLLPWILHESSHHIRVLDRKVRNEFIVTAICTTVFNKVICEILHEFAKDSFYIEMGRKEEELIECMISVAKQDIIQQKEVEEYSFEKIKFQITLFFERLFKPVMRSQDSYYEGKESKKQIIEVLLNEIRKEEMLYDEKKDYLAMIQEIKNSENVNSNIQKLMESLLDRYNNKLMLIVKENHEMEKRIQLNDLYEPMAWLESRLLEITDFLTDQYGQKNVKDALKNYCFSVKFLHRVVNLTKRMNWHKEKEEEYVEQFLKKVFESYQKKTAETDINEEIFSDSEVLYVWKNIGLLNYNEEDFSEQIKEAFRKVQYESIQMCINYQVSIYREACADLFMVTSLNMDSFGYCRQVLQTISDAELEREQFSYSEINFERFRIVIATLLYVENAKYIEMAGGQVKVNGDFLVEQGKVYCTYTLKCIEEKILHKVETNEEKALVRRFISIVDKQLQVILKVTSDRAYENTILNIVLHGEKAGMDSLLRDAWHKFDDIANYFPKCKYLFWRLECFCKGINSILQKGYIYVQKDVLDHMIEILRKIKTEAFVGCIWEKEKPEWLKSPELNVGEFYNNPVLVHQMTSSQKLENTIEFIQNYYYYNRFRVMGEMDS